MLITLNRGRLLAPPGGGGGTWVNFYWLRAAGLLRTPTRLQSIL